MDIQKQSHKALLMATALLGLIFGASAPAAASAITLDTWYTFGFGGPGTPLTSGVGFVLGTNPYDPDAAGGGSVDPSLLAPDPAWTITTTGPATLRVVDGFLSTDQFTMFDFLVPFSPMSGPVPGGGCGSDITCSFLDPRYSRGEYALAPGSHSFTGTQILGSGGAGFFEVEPTAAAVPEPATFALLGAGVAALGAIRQRRKAKA